MSSTTQPPAAITTAGRDVLAKATQRRSQTP
jgi:hypothetical protein